MNGKFLGLPYRPVTYLLVIIFIIGCSSDGDEDVMDPVAPTNPELSAIAGNDRNVLIENEVSMIGNASSNTNDAISYSWRFISKPSSSQADLENEGSQSATFTPDVPGKYKLELTVTSDALQDSDQVTVAAFDVKEIDGLFTNLIPGANVGIAKFAVVADRLYATCEFDEIGNIQAKKIACYDGNVWAALGCGLEDGSIYDMIAYQGDLYVTGEFEEIGCVAANNIARWDGQNWHDVQGGLTGGEDPSGNALMIYNGELYVGGSFTMAGNISVSNIAKWDGISWAAAGTFQDGSILELQIYGQELIAGGTFESVNGVSTGSIASFDGASWSTLGSTNGLEQGSTGYINEMAVLEEILYIAGYFSENGNVYSELISWDGSEFKDFGKAFSLNQTNTISELNVVDDILYIGGNFTNVVGSQANSILQWDGSQWGILQNGINGTVLSVEEFSNSIYIGGDFTSAGGNMAENISIWESN